MTAPSLPSGRQINFQPHALALSYFVSIDLNGLRT